MSGNSEPPLITSLSGLSIPANHNLPRRSQPRVREVSSRFMSSVLSMPKQTPSLRRSQTDTRSRFGDENRPDTVNRRSVSPVRSCKPRSAVKLFKEATQPDTLAPVVFPTPGRVLRHRNWDNVAVKPVRANNNANSDDDASSIDSDCESVRSEPCENSHNNSNARVSTPFSKSIELPLSTHEQRKGLNDEKGTGFTIRGRVKVARSLNLPPMPPMFGLGKGQGAVEVKKAVRKGSSHVEDVHRVKMLYNRYIQWRHVNSRANACMIARKSQCERQLYSVGVKLSQLRDSVKSKCMEYGYLKALRTLSTLVDVQMPYLEEWSTLEDGFSASLLELVNGLLNVLSQLPLVENVRADMKEIEEAIDSALKAMEMIILDVQRFMPKANEVDSLISDLARVYIGEVTLVDECGGLLSKTRLSQVEECSLRGELMQLNHLKLNELEDYQC